MKKLPEPSFLEKEPLFRILEEIDRQEAQLLKLLISLAKIPAPTGKEQRKISFIADTVRSFGLKGVSIDKIGNCVVNMPSKNKKAKTLLVVAHADTACDPGEKVEIKEDSKYLYGHGTCDNCAGVTGLLTTISLIKKHNLQFSNNIIFGFTVGEEGLGAKRGMKQLIKEFGKNVEAVINCESHHIGRVTNQAIGQFRTRIEVDTKLGGHSFRDFGRSNANVILAKIITSFSEFKLPQKRGKTTFNVGQLLGEGSINSIPQVASCLFEIRSEDNSQLQQSRKKFEEILDKYRKQFKGVKIASAVSAEVPAVIFPSSHKIYRTTIEVQKNLGITPKINAGNTDGDVSLAAGIPTVTIGTSEGVDTHSLKEYMEKKSLKLGVKQVFSLVYQVASFF